MVIAQRIMRLFRWAALLDPKVMVEPISSTKSNSSYCKYIRFQRRVWYKPLQTVVSFFRHWAKSDRHTPQKICKHSSVQVWANGRLLRCCGVIVAHVWHGQRVFGTGSRSTDYLSRVIYLYQCLIDGPVCHSVGNILADAVRQHQQWYEACVSWVFEKSKRRAWRLFCTDDLALE